jgi:hypothetical protein
MALPPIVAKRFVVISRPNPFGFREAAFVFEQADGTRFSVIACDPETVSDPLLREVFRDRLETNATGRCPRCGAMRRLVNPSQTVTEHEPDCLCGDEQIRELIGRRYGLGRN